MNHSTPQRSLVLPITLIAVAILTSHRAIVLTSVGTTVTAAQGVEPPPQGTDPMAGDLGVSEASEAA